MNWLDGYPMIAPSLIGAEFGFVAAVILGNIVLFAVLKEWRSLVAAAAIGIGAVALSTRAGTSGIEVGSFIVNPGTPFSGFLISLFLIAAIALTGVMTNLKYLGKSTRLLLGALAVAAAVHAVLSFVPAIAPMVRNYGTPALTVMILLILAGVAQDAKKQEAGGGGLLASAWLIVALTVAMSEASVSISALNLFSDQPVIRDIVASSIVLEGYRLAYLVAILLMTTQIALLSWDDFHRKLNSEQAREERKRRVEEARRLQDAADYEHLQRLRQSQRETENKLREQVLARNEALQLAKEASEEASKAKSSFIAFLSHEIRTPLNGLMGSARLLSRTRLAGDQHEYVQALTYSGEALLTLVNDVLDMSKIEAGKLELESIDFDIRRLLQSIALVMHARADEKGLKLISDADEALPVALRGDPNRLRQILLNLVNNAVKFTEKGSVTVRAVGVGEAAEGVLPVRFEVVDTGIGIPDDAKGKIFSEYGQVDSSTARLYGGTGLGLNICKQLVEAMDGSIGFESTEGEGTTFYFTVELAVGDADAVLPVESESASPPAAPSSERIEAETDFDEAVDVALEVLAEEAADEAVRAVTEDKAVAAADPAALPPLKVLLVEDDAVSRMVIEGYLGPQGHDIEAVDSGEAAIKLAQEEDFDVILMDVHLTDMTGLEAARWIRQIDHAQRRDVPIIAMTGNVTDEDKTVCRDAGMDAFVGKPVDPDALEAALASLIEARPAEEAAVPTAALTPEAVDTLPVGEKNVRSAQRVLYVEDDPISQEVVAAFMESDGFQVHTVSDGESALRALDHERYDAVLMDVRLPGISGVETAERIRSHSDPLVARVPVIAISQYDSPDNRTNCLEAGMDDFLAKPVDPAFLRAAILRLKQAREADRQRMAAMGIEDSDEEARDGFGNVIDSGAIALDPDVAYNVLIIEDDPISQEVVSQYLTNGGHQAIAVDNAEDGLEILVDQDIDVVLMDVDLPGISGLDATRIIREMDDAEKSQTPVIAITGNISQQDIEGCRDAGMNDFIGKPVNPGYLSGAIRRVVRIREEAAERADLPVDQDALLMLLDSGTLNHLRRAFTPEKLSGLLEQFMERAEAIIGVLDDAADRDDRTVLRSQAHLLKGMSANVGMAALKELASDIEKAAGEGDTGDIKEMIAQLSPMLDASRMALDYLQPASEQVA